MGRLLTRVGAAAALAWCASLVLADESYDDLVPGSVDPIATRAMQPAVDAASVAALLVLFVTMLATFGHTAVRLRRADSPQREQLAWLAVVTLPLLVASFVAPPPLVLLAALLFPVGIVVGVLRYRLLDIRLVLRGTLVYALLTVLVLAAYAGVIAALAAVIPRSVLPSVLAAAIVAVGVRPAYDVLHRAVTRFVYGDQRDPVRAIGRLGRELAATGEERARLRGDLHDGLGRRCRASPWASRAAQMARDDPVLRDELLVRLREEVQGAVTEVRRLVDGLRPGALDRAGLVGAIQAHVTTLSAADGIDMVVTAPDELPPLAPPVEVAAYRIALEALTNVVRHSGAHACSVALRVGDGLELEVRDDGVGFPSHPAPGGVGLESMQARAAAVGGTLLVGPANGGGTSVRALLPLASR